MKRPFTVRWDTGCSSNFSTLEKAREVIQKGLNRTDGNLQRGAARIGLRDSALIERIEPRRETL
jgi:hypothetical protein